MQRGVFRCMPWKVSDAVKERTKFVLKWEERFRAAEGGRVNVSELSRMFGISRQTAYEWIRRYRDTGSLDALLDRSKRPHRSPTKVSEEVESLIVAARKQRPTWGSRAIDRMPRGSRLSDEHDRRARPSACLSSDCFLGRSLRCSMISAPTNRNMGTATKLAAPAARAPRSAVGVGQRYCPTRQPRHRFER